MITQDSIDTIRGATVYDNDGDKIGKVSEVYLDDRTGEPAWMTVTTGLFGTSQTFVPLQEASLNGDDVRVPYEKAKIKDAPRVAADGHLDVAEEDSLYEYYGVGGMTGGTADIGTGRTYDNDTTDTTRTTTGTTTGAAGYADETREDRFDTTTTGGYREGREGLREEGLREETGNRHGTVGHDTSGPTTDNAMTRSEEQLRVGTQTREAGRARLRKYVVTEQQSVTVPVSHEEVTLEREPITDANVGDALDGPGISEEEHEVVLREEVPVVTKETRPVERVRATTETVTGEQTVSDDVRKERIEMEGAGEGRTGLRDGVDDDYTTGTRTGRDDLTR